VLLLLLLQDDGSQVTAQVGLLGGEVNKLLAAHARWVGRGPKFLWHSSIAAAVAGIAS
jgi:hypothetical protein